MKQASKLASDFKRRSRRVLRDWEEQTTSWFKTSSSFKLASEFRHKSRKTFNEWDQTLSKTRWWKHRRDPLVVIGISCIFVGICTHYIRQRNERKLQSHYHPKMQDPDNWLTTGERPWKLISAADGSKVNQDILSGKTVLMFFGYTRCPVVTPRTVKKLVEVCDRLKDMNIVAEPYLVSLDWRRDTRGDLQRFAKSMGSKTTVVTALCGNERQIKKICEVFQVSLGKAFESVAEFSILDHTTIIYLMVDGKLEEVFESGVDVAAIEEKVEKLVTLYRHSIPDFASVDVIE